MDIDSDEIDEAELALLYQALCPAIWPSRYEGTFGVSSVRTS
jgi:hypothetical protein